MFGSKQRKPSSRDRIDAIKAFSFICEEVSIVARCPKLDYESNNPISMSSDKYICEITGRKMDVDDPKVKNVCKVDYGDEYEKCPVYQSR